MKARIGLLVLILALSASLSVGQSLGWWTSPWAGSFRKASTAGLLEDDLDLMLDPARLPMIEGNRLYTNLSNLVGKNDDMFDNNGNGYYLLGGSGKIMELGYGGLLYDRNIERQYDTTTTNYSILRDVDASGTYDQKEQHDVISTASHQYKATDWWIGYGREMGPGKFGLLFYHAVYSTHEQPMVNNEIITVNDLVTGATTSLTDTKTAHNFMTDQNINGGALSYWYPFNDKIDLGVAGGIRINKVEEIDSITYAYKQTDPSAPGQNGTTIDSTAYGDIIPHDGVGMNIIGRVAGVYKWSDKVKTRTDIYFSMLVGGKKDDSYRNSSYHSLTAYQIMTGLQYTDVNRVTNAAVKQEDHYNNVGLTSNTFVKFSDKVEMAIGLGMDSYNRDWTNTATGTYSSTTVYNDGSATTFTDTRDVVTGNINLTQTYTEAGLSISTPVCVEFHITKPFVFRLGATHTFDYWSTSYDSTYQVDPRVLTHTDAYGVVTQTILDNPFTANGGQLYYHKYAESYLNYTYGAGWEISKNLQIDLMGFAKLDDMTNWKLSAVFKF